jgi:glycosyltransferase involved in cell wall biosynthesis
VRAVVVVVPVHDEEQHLERCLTSIHRALAHPRLRGLDDLVVVSLDACRDGSAAIAERLRRRSDVVVCVEARNVGTARAVGALAGLEAVRHEPDRVWLAHTDADTVVPPGWLAGQLEHADTAEGVAGIVRVDDWAPHRVETRLRFERGYRSPLLRPHRHVHGANIGVRAGAYLDVGGFPHLPCSEDHALWDALRAGGHRVVASRRVWVTTSGRRVPRARGGFADTLLELERAVLDGDRASPDCRPSGMGMG